MTQENGEIRIYVACLAAYNAGYLHGRWIDAERGVSHIWNEVNAMLTASPIEEAEEWVIHDYEGFEGVSISEWEGFESVTNIAEFISEHGELGGQLIAHYGGVEEAKSALEDHYAGEYKSVSDFVQEMTEQTTEIPDSLIYYIDWDAMARDWEINDINVIETGVECVHIFWNH